MRTIVLASIAALMLASAADAQTAMTTPPAKTMKAKPAASTSAMSTSTSTMPTTTRSGRKPQTPESKACSAQADAKNLHGNDRKKFRTACLKGK